MMKHEYDNERRDIWVNITAHQNVVQCARDNNPIQHG